MKARMWQGAVVGGVLVAISYGGASYWMGLKAEQTLAEQHKIIAGLPLFVVKSHSYQRGWFSSTETTELALNPNFFRPYQSLLPDGAKALLDGRIQYVNRIQHGPLPEIGSFGFIPARAVVQTDFTMSDDTKKTLTRFFGDKAPITVTNRLNFIGGGDLTVSVPKFDYEETLSGVKINWQGLLTRVHYAAGYKQYSVDARFPGLMVEAATKGRFGFTNLAYQSDSRPGETGVTVGNSELSVAKVQLESKENLPYKIRLNELVSLLTRIRVGEFINPAGEIKPSQAALSDLKYQIVTSEQGEFIDTRGKFQFERFEINHTSYGPMKLDVSANHLHAASVLKLDRALSAIKIEGVEPAALRQQYLDTITLEGGPILANNPPLIVNTFSLKLPEGEMSLTGNLALNGYVDGDLKTPLVFMKKLEADAKLTLPHATLQSLVIAQARNLFTVDASAENQPSLAEIDDLAKNLLATQLDTWAEQGYLSLTNGQINTAAVWKKGELSINQHLVALPWQEEMAGTKAEAGNAAPVPLKQ